MMKFQHPAHERTPPLQSRANHQPQQTGNRHKGLSDENFQLLLAVGHEIHARDGQLVFQEGEAQDNIIVVLDGKVKVGIRAHTPVWMNMGAYGMIDLEEEESQTNWKRAQLYSQVVCLGKPDSPLEQGHSLAAISAGESHLLVVDVKTLQKTLQSHPNQGNHLLENLRQLMTQP